MVNILVPTDFSELSKIAVQYAVRIANKLEGNVTLLHVLDLGEKVRATLRMKTNSRQVVKALRKNFEKLVADVSMEIASSSPIDYKIAEGMSFGDTVMKESRKLRSGLIVMGTRGASGLKKAVIGSNTASMIGVSHIPVLAVPEKAEFKKFRNVIYATDLKNIEAELKVLMPYIQRFGSTVHILHIVEDASQIELVEEKISAIVAKEGYRNIVALVTFDTDIDGAIDHYISVSKADLLAMFTHEPSFYEKVFDKSITRKMAFYSNIPLLAFRQK